MILTEEQAVRHLTSEKNVLRDIESVHVKDFKNGKVICHEGGGAVKKLGTIQKRVIASVAIESGDKSGTAEAFGISRQAATNISNGKTADGTKPDVELRDFVERKRQSVAEVALAKTLEAFNLITGDKLSKVSARDLASIAKDSATVYDKLSGKSGGSGSGVKVMIYAPTVRSVGEYDVIEVGEGK